MRRYRCLVVEDSKTMRNMLAESLARIPGMEVVEAENGLAAVRDRDEVFLRLRYTF